MIAIVYISKHGTTEKVAKEIAKELHFPDVELINLREDKNPDVSSFDKIILGGSIHAGLVQKRMKAFCEKNLSVLLTKQIALFLCCMEEGDKAKEQFENAYPEILRQHAIKKEFLGGEFLFEKMNFLEKALVRKIAGVSENTSKLNREKIKEFTIGF